MQTTTGNFIRIFSFIFLRKRQHRLVFLALFSFWPAIFLNIHIVNVPLNHDETIGTSQICFQFWDLRGRLGLVQRDAK